MKRFRKKILTHFLALLTLFTALPAGGVSASEENLVSGLPYTVKTGVGIEYSYKLYGSESDPADGKLTDGIRASSTGFSDPAWHKFYRGLSRTVEFELSTEKAVTGFSVSMVHSTDAGLPMPPSFDLYVSENGTDWMLAGAFDAADLQSAGGTAHRELKTSFDKRYKAKYVRVSFRISVSTYLDEIEIYGGDLNGTEEAFVKCEEPSYPNAFDEGVEGVREMVLLYCGYQGDYDISYVQNTEEEMLYYFGYVDKEGKVTDTFFDSFLFSPLRGAAPSGGSLNESGKKQTTKEDWEYYLNSIFDLTYNCGAIEKTMETVKSAAGQSDATVSLVISIPFPTIGDKPFGDLDGDGESEYCRNTEEQLAIYSWFFDTALAMFEERNYQNIRFGGFYWEQEGLSMEESYLELVKSVSDRIHERGTKFFWIPFLYGNGFDMVEEMGFDSAMMQPNYSFLDYVEEPFLTELTAELKKYGLGIEIEIHWDVLNRNNNLADQYLSRYYSYLNGGYELGYMNGVAHAYYQNSSPGTYYHLAKSSVSKLRNVYDDTYAFVKGTYTPRVIELTTRENTVEADETARGYIRLSTGSVAVSLGQAEWLVTAQPANGTVSIDSDGIYTYVPNEGFTGTDSFTVCLAATYASSEELTVQIGVGTDTEAEERSSEDSVSVPDVQNQTLAQTKKPSVLPWMIGGLAALVAVAAGVVITRKRRK